MGIPVKIKTGNASAYVPSKMKQIFTYYNIKNITSIPQIPTGQAFIQSSNCTLKDTINKQKRVIKTPRNRLNNALSTLNFLMLMRKK